MTIVDSLIGIQSNPWILGMELLAAIVILFIVVQYQANHEKEDKKDGKTNNS
jgi:hypothetical protein